MGRYWFYPHKVVQMPCINAAQSQPRMESLCLSAYELPIGITEYISNRLGGSSLLKKYFGIYNPYWAESTSGIAVGNQTVMTDKQHFNFERFPPTPQVAIRKSWPNRIKER